MPQGRKNVMFADIIEIKIAFGEIPIAKDLKMNFRMIPDDPGNRVYSKITDPVQLFIP